MRKFKDPATAMKDRISKAKRTYGKTQKDASAEPKQKRLALKKLKRAQRKLRTTLAKQAMAEKKRGGKKKKSE